MVFLTTYESYCESFGAESPSSSNSVQVAVGISRHIVVEHDIDFFNINTTSKHISSNQNAVL